jgi:hypothetical protein
MLWHHVQQQHISTACQHTPQHPAHTRAPALHAQPPTSPPSTLPAAQQQQQRPVLQPVLPKTGLVVSEKGAATDVLAGPILLPIKSAAEKRNEALLVCVCVCGTCAAVWRAWSLPAQHQRQTQRRASAPP